MFSYSNNKPIKCPYAVRSVVIIRQRGSDRPVKTKLWPSWGPLWDDAVHLKTNFASVADELPNVKSGFIYKQLPPKVLFHHEEISVKCYWKFVMLFQLYLFCFKGKKITASINRCLKKTASGWIRSSGQSCASAWGRLWSFPVHNSSSIVIWLDEYSVEEFDWPTQTTPYQTPLRWTSMKTASLALLSNISIWPQECSSKRMSKKLHGIFRKPSQKSWRALCKLQTVWRHQQTKAEELQVNGASSGPLRACPGWSDPLTESASEWTKLSD